MTRSTDSGAAQIEGAAPRRVIQRSPGVPTGRALLGGALVALSFVGMFVAWRHATGSSGQLYAVAARPLSPGDAVSADDVRFQSIRLPAGVAHAAFPDGASLEGRVAVAPVREGELLQAGALSDAAKGPPFGEVSLQLDRALAVDGRLHSGDLVDVYGSGANGTDLVAAGIRVVTVDADGGSFGNDDQLTVTLALAGPGQEVSVIHAARTGTVTLVRTTHAGRDASASGAGLPPHGPPPGGGGA